MMTEYRFDVNNYVIEYDGHFFAHLNVNDAQKIVNKMNEQDKKIKEQAKMIRTRNAFLASNGFAEDYRHFVDRCKGEYDD